MGYANENIIFRDVSTSRERRATADRQDVTLVAGSEPYLRGAASPSSFRQRAGSDGRAGAAASQREPARPRDRHPAAGRGPSESVLTTSWSR